MSKGSGFEGIGNDPCHGAIIRLWVTAILIAFLNVGLFASESSLDIYRWGLPTLSHHEHLFTTLRCAYFNAIAN